MWTWLRTCAGALACTGMLIPGSYLHAQQPPVQPATATFPLDIKLDGDGILHGHLVNGLGVGVAETTIKVSSGLTYLANAKTGPDGQFVIPVDRGGIYQLAIEDRVIAVVRCWKRTAAPPSALERVCVNEDTVFRGQISPAACGFANPWVITGIAVTAIVIPVALHNNRSDRQPSSN